MATYNQVSYGSKGSDVTELQKLLNNNGYNLDVDGSFGSKTQAAVRDYQKKNNLSVDGIVGNNTWGALTKAQTQSTTPSTSAGSASSSGKTETKAPTFEYKGYQESDTVAQAEALLQQQLANKPGAYQSAWQTQLNEVIKKIMNREQFSYDLNGDALYQQYKDQYVNQGKMAMMDTMGQAAALTGGYGNSYAQSVGQQAYQGYLQGLNDKIPELYQLALSKYQMEGDAMYDQAALMAQQEDQDYGRYRDQVSDYYTELDRLYNQYNTERDYDYSKWADSRDFAYGQYADDRAYDYQAERDKVSDEQWQAEFDEAKRQYDQAYALESGGSSGGSSGGPSGGSGGSSGGGGSSYDPDTAAIQQQLVNAGYDIAVDGVWGPKTQAAYDAYNGKVDDGGDDSPTYGSIVDDLNTYIKNGASKSKINNYLRSAYQSGYISQAQYSQLKNQFAPRGSTY